MLVPMDSEYVWRGNRTTITGSVFVELFTLHAYYKRSLPYIYIQLITTWDSMDYLSVNSSFHSLQRVCCFEYFPHFSLSNSSRPCEFRDYYLRLWCRNKCSDLFNVLNMFSVYDYIVLTFPSSIRLTDRSIRKLPVCFPSV